MSFDLARIKRIDKGQRLTVFGYLRESFDDDITDLICYICLLFYASMPVFAKCSINLKLSGDDQDTISPIDDTCAWCSAFGKSWIESTSKEIIEWKIKLNDDGDFSPKHVCLAIISNHHEQDVEDLCRGRHSYYWPMDWTDKMRNDDKLQSTIDQLHREPRKGDTIISY